MHRGFAANTCCSYYHNIDIFVTRCYTVVRLDYDTSLETIVLDFARAIIYVYISFLASELVPFIAEEVPCLVTIKSLRMAALCLDQEQTGGQTTCKKRFCYEV